MDLYFLEVYMKISNTHLHPHAIMYVRTQTHTQFSEIYTERSWLSITFGIVGNVIAKSSSNPGKNCIHSRSNSTHVLYSHLLLKLFTESQSRCPAIG